jgi:hypothetical protein
VHAEQFLMANLVLHGEQSLQTLAISAAPCGHCRQFYSELACAVSTALYNVFVALIGGCFSCGSVPSSWLNLWCFAAN